MLSANYMTPAELVASGVKPNWKSPAITKAFGLLQQLVDKGYMTKNAEAIPLFPDAINNFGAGKAAFMVGLAANNANWSEFSKDAIGKNLGAMLPPLAPDALMKQQEFDYGPALSWSITKWSKNPDAAYKYFSFLATPAAQVMIYKGSGILPEQLQGQGLDHEPGRERDPRLGATKKTYVGQVTLIRANVEAAFDKVVPQVLTKQLSTCRARCRRSRTRRTSRLRFPRTDRWLPSLTEARQLELEHPARTASLAVRAGRMLGEAVFVAARRDRGGGT